MKFEPTTIEKPDFVESGPLFAGDRDWHNNACIGFSESFYAYIEGYRCGADRLVQSIVDGGRSQDLLVYPVAFLYRQYLELSLKDIIQSGRQLTDDTGEFPYSHRLNKLWGETKRVLNGIKELSPILNADVKVLDRVIAEFDALDPGSDAFRYPTNRAGQRLLADITHVNLRRLRDGVGYVGNILNGVRSELAILHDLRNEWLAEIAYEL